MKKRKSLILNSQLYATNENCQSRQAQSLLIRIVFLRGKEICDKRAVVLLKYIQSHLYHVILFLNKITIKSKDKIDTRKIDQLLEYFEK